MDRLRREQLPDRPTLTFNESATNTVYLTVSAAPGMPPAHDAFPQIRLGIRWFYRQTGGGVGDTVWDVAYACTGAGANYQSPSFSTPVLVTTTASSNSTALMVSKAMPVPTTCAAGDIITIRLRRLGADAADTLPEGSVFYGAEVAVKSAYSHLVESRMGGVSVLISAGAGRAAALSYRGPLWFSRGFLGGQFVGVRREAVGLAPQFVCQSSQLPFGHLRFLFLGFEFPLAFLALSDIVGHVDHTR